ncbi:MAG TPA: acetyl-CoA carboxylase, biotin carboxyl carrier protein [Lentisphaeria bacterium]|nr:MAG: acetyl-CoA carboxylase, biotin carboxyl carrier protein [Lentisphaerae bacterium GWF2_49_21]HBC88057.1 acetyl-CoA carboxylase, biotin carboxyl carrier protein [Lentisphaeria bacterium]
MEIEKIKTIVELMSDHDLTEFKIESDDMHLCIRRGNSHPGMMTVTHTQQPVITTMPAAAPASQPPAETGDAKSGAASKVETAKRETIDSPIVGTFYRAPSPDAESFVKTGSKVNPDTVVCIIEAMKVMNEIKAEKSGTIKEILVENAKPVEFGQPLFVIE